MSTGTFSSVTRNRRRRWAGLVLAGVLALTTACSSAGTGASSSQQSNPADAGDGTTSENTSAESTAPESSESAAPPKSSGATDSAELNSLLPESIRERGYMSAGTFSFPPTTIITPEGAYEGILSDLARQIERYLGVEIRLENVSLDSLIPSLQSGKYDVGFGNVGVKEDRLEVVDYVTTHNLTVTGLTHADDALAPETWLDLCGVRVAALSGSVSAKLVPIHQEECKKQGKSEIQLLTFKEQNQANLAVESGNADITLASSLGLNELIEKFPGKYKLTGTFEEHLGGVVVAKQNPDKDALTAALAAAVNASIQDGSYRAIVEKWIPNIVGGFVIDKAEVLRSTDDL